MFEQPSMAVSDVCLDHIHFRGIEPVRKPREPITPTRSGRPVASSRVSRKLLAAQPLPPFIPWLFETVGIAAAAYRPLPMHRRIPACLRELRVKTPEAARALLIAQPQLLPVALDSMLLGVSAFFRDAAVFDSIARDVLPAILNRRERVRVLSVGVSDGHELYSLAMLLAEARALGRCSLLGIDCRPEAIRRAAEGVFSDNDMAAISAERRDRFFVREKTAWRTSAELRAAIDWRVADLFSFRPPACDLILFRNVAIYLDDDWIAWVWRELTDALSVEGYLVTGKAEKPPASLPLRRVFASIYQKATT